LPDCDSSGEGWIERLASEEGLEGGQQRYALLAQRREVLFDACQQLAKYQRTEEQSSRSGLQVWIHFTK